MPDQTIYFKNGKMYKVYPSDQENWYDAKYLVSDGIIYDLENVLDIKRIPVPDFAKSNPDLMSGYGVTGSLDYVIRMKAGNARSKGLIRESDELYRKAILLMQASGISYDERPYLYYAKELLREGRFQESEIEEKRAYAIVEQQRRAEAYPYKTLHQKLFFQTLEVCKELGRDHLEIMYLYSCCEQCAKYHGRVYSISGKDKRFPKIPDFILETGEIHPGCSHSITSFDPRFNTILFRGADVDAVIISNRPFVDDRTDSEKQAYNDYLKRRKKDSRPYITTDEKEYYRIKYTLPDIAPKSLSGYVRMKNARSKNFMKLRDIAENRGIRISLLNQ